MKKLLVLTLSALLLLGLCGCSRTNVRDPLLFISAEEDSACLTDRGILRVDDGFVTAGKLVIQLSDGTQAVRGEGPLELPGAGADITEALPTTMTVGQARIVLQGMFSQVTTAIGSAGYLLEFCPADTAVEAPDYTYSMLDKTLTEGKQEDVDETMGSFVVDEAGPMGRIWIKP